MSEEEKSFLDDITEVPDIQMLNQLLNNATFQVQGRTYKITGSFVSTAHEEVKNSQEDLNQ